MTKLPVVLIKNEINKYSIKYGERQDDKVVIEVKNINDLQEVYNAVRLAVGGINAIAAKCVELVMEACDSSQREPLGMTQLTKPTCMSHFQKGRTRMKRKKFRPDLSEYEIFVMTLVDKLNEDALFKMSKTDAVKIAIEKAVKNLLPDVVIKPKRNRYETLKF